MNSDTNEVGQRLRVIVQDGELVPEITCTSDGILRTTMMWRRDSSESLPDGVMQSFEFLGPTSQHHLLIWQRSARYDDSGRYICSSPSTSTTPVLELEVISKLCA